MNMQSLFKTEMPYIMIDVSGAENTLKVGGVFQHFS